MLKMAMKLTWKPNESYKRKQVVSNVGISIAEKNIVECNTELRES